jgi:hypothetical protein
MTHHPYAIAALCVVLVLALYALEQVLSCREQRRKRDQDHEDYDAI